MPLNIKDYFPKTTTKEDYYRELFKKTDFKINAISYKSGIPGLGFVVVTPQQMDNTIRAMYLIDVFQEKLDYVESFFAKGLGYCQEAFGSMLEFDEGVLRFFLGNSLEYLHKKLDEYERQNKNEIEVEAKASDSLALQ